jgi:hypothetical protein
MRGSLMFARATAIRRGSGSPKKFASCTLTDNPKYKTGSYPLTSTLNHQRKLKTSKKETKP